MTPMYFLFPLWMLLQAAGLPQGAQPAQTAQAANNAKPGIVRGHVYASDTGLAVKHADVSLRPTGRFQPQEVSTDTQGGFQFLNVDPGAYTLSCNKSGFVGSSYGAKNANQPPTTFRVGDSQELKDIDCRMPHGGAITGIITNDEGEPVIYATVQVMQKTYRRGQVQLQARGSAATTDDRGRYRIFELSPGRYYVQATRRGAGPSATRDAAYAAVIYPSASRLQDAQALTLAAGGEVSGIDMVLRSVPTYTVSGKVIDLVAGHAVGAGNISALPDDFFMGGGGGFGSGTIKPDGTFQLKGLTPGHYRLQVMGFGEGGGRGGRGGFGGPGGQGQAGGQGGAAPAPPRIFTKAIDIGTQNITDLVIAIGPGATIKGKVQADGGALPANMRVNMTPRSEAGAAGFRGAGGTSSAQVADDGTFEIPEVQTGSYDLVFNSRGGAPGGQGGANAFFTGGGGPQNITSGFFLSAVTSGGQDVLESGIVVPEGGTILQVAATIDFRSSTITGRALNEDGDPMAGVPVVLVSSDAKKRTIDRYFKTTFADSNGNYSFSAVIPGSYLMVLWPESDPYTVQDPDVMTQLEKQAVRVSVERASSTTQDLKMTSEIRVIAQTFAQ